MLEEKKDKISFIIATLKNMTTDFLKTKLFECYINGLEPVH